MLTITGTEQWQRAHPGAVIGLLEISGVDNTRPCPALDERKRETEARLRQQYGGFTRKDFLSLPMMAAYDKYYNRFDKTYHVLLQLESIVLKGKNLPDVSPLVDSNFTAEVETLVLTAGHAASKLRAPVCIDVSREGDQMTQLNGAVKSIRAGVSLCSALASAQSQVAPATPTVLITGRAGVSAWSLPGSMPGAAGR